MRMRTSMGYQFTTYDETDERIALLKQQARVTNASRRVGELANGEGVRRYTWLGSDCVMVTRQRVVVRGRLGKDNPYAPLYRKGGKHWRFSSMTIRPEHATRFDVYIHEATRTIKG